MLAQINYKIKYNQVNCKQVDLLSLKQTRMDYFWSLMNYLWNRSFVTYRAFRDVRLIEIICLLFIHFWTMNIYFQTRRAFQLIAYVIINAISFKFHLISILFDAVRIRQKIHKEVLFAFFMLILALFVLIFIKGCLLDDRRRLMSFNFFLNTKFRVSNTIRQKWFSCYVNGWAFLSFLFWSQFWSHRTLLR